MLGPDDRGYDDARHWSAAGWAWRQRALPHGLPRTKGRPEGLAHRPQRATQSAQGPPIRAHIQSLRLGSGQRFPETPGRHTGAVHPARHTATPAHHGRGQY